MSILESQSRYPQPNPAALPRLVPPPSSPLASPLPPASAESPAGSLVERVVAGRFRLKQLLGRGAMGEVYRAFDLHKRHTCAIKLICPGTERRLRIRSRASTSSALLALKPHPNIVEVYELGQDLDGTRFLAMELLRGIDLKGLLRRTERLPLRQALIIARSVGSALEHAHAQGIVHRDLSPGSIFLCQRPDRRESGAKDVKVLDFAMASLRAELIEHRRPSASQAAELVTCEIMVGTPGYLPPEWACSQGGSCDPRGDQWSLAAITYQMLAGQLPFAGSDRYPFSRTSPGLAPCPLKSLAAGLPEHIYDAVHTALEFSPDSRFESVRDFLRALEGLPGRRRGQVRRAVDLTLVDEVPLPQRLGLSCPQPVEDQGADATAQPDAVANASPEEINELARGGVAAPLEPLSAIPTVVCPMQAVQEHTRIDLPVSAGPAPERNPRLTLASTDLGSLRTQLAPDPRPAPQRAAAAPAQPHPASPRRPVVQRQLRAVPSRDLMVWRPVRLFLFFAMGALAMSLLAVLTQRVYWVLRDHSASRGHLLIESPQPPARDVWTDSRAPIPNHIPRSAWRPPHPPFARRPPPPRIRLRLF